MSGLDQVVVADTCLSEIEGEKGQLSLRGYPIGRLAEEHIFEENLYFLLTGRYPTIEEIGNVSQQLIAAMQLDEEYLTFLETVPLHLDAISYLMVALSAINRQKFTWPPTRDQALHLQGTVLAILGQRQSRLEARPLTAPDAQLNFAGNFLYMIFGQRPTEDETKALDCYFTLTMEHGLNASSFTSRVITSTESDLISAIVGAMGALKGPLHGGAPSEVIKMLEEIGRKENIDTWLKERLENKEKVMGFGHRVYRTKDPRALMLKKVVKSFNREEGWLQLALALEEKAERALKAYKPNHSLKTNVEFYAAALFKTIGLPQDLYTATFATSRLAGWCAHALEQAENNRIIRPMSRYIGPKYE
ncbi:citrate synthase [Pullulanibacillus pueri]|uniref:Citrate synthase n=1 Tax=Pullulanibacillus pueri TaxID=1437324 RepID=A0A8J3END7_9BACL|nr:citrate/2-methylcitrate synthase [Pullulanibacillus pueri]MBM7683804.1 citrate synthase [Pullulanibacillus pueri]GGH87646.1 citrate synthase 1 [Pullulanibacillus pueri]